LWAQKPIVPWRYWHDRIPDFHVSVWDTETFKTYRTRAAAAIAAHGGRYLARGGAIEVFEGTWHPRTIIIV
jgi:uncharacterized protein (DUF1330 family)